MVERIISQFIVSGIFPKGVFSSRDNFDIPPINLSPISEYLEILNRIPFSIEISRGCSFGCRFCYLRDFIKPIRAKSINALLRDFAILDDYGIKNLILADVNLNPNSHYCKKLLDILSSYDCKIILETRLDYISQDIIEDLNKAGISEIIYGVEHINLDILSSMEKNIKNYGSSWEKMTFEITELLNNSNITPHPIFMLGWPGETYDTLKNLTRLACELGRLNNVEPFVSFATPHPGSSFKTSFKSQFSSIAKDLRKYIHILPAATPKSLSESWYRSLSLLIYAHNRIRTDSNMTYRNPTISIGDVLNYWDHTDYTSTPFLKGKIE